MEKVCGDLQRGARQKTGAGEMIWRWLRNLFCGSWRVKYLATGIGMIEDLRTRERKKVHGVFTIEENDKGERRAFFSAESYPISPVSVEDVLRGVGAIGEWKNTRVGECQSR